MLHFGTKILGVIIIKICISNIREIADPEWGTKYELRSMNAATILCKRSTIKMVWIMMASSNIDTGKEFIYGLTCYIVCTLQRYWDHSKWIESESLTFGRPFYSQLDQGKTTWKKPKELIDNDDYDEMYKEYPWKKQMDYLDDTCSQKIDIKPFRVSTNTFPVRLNPKINVLQYDINIAPKLENDIEPKHVQQLKHRVDISKLFKRCKFSDRI